MKIDPNAPHSTLGDPLHVASSRTHLEPEELRQIHELFASDDEVPHEADEDAAAQDTELSHDQVKHHTDNAVEDETNGSLYQGQHLPE